MNIELQKIYDNFAKKYEENRDTFDTSEIVDKFYKQLDNERKILDIGCGTGEPISKYFVEHGWDVIGVDFSGEMIKLANKYVPEMTTIHEDICEVMFRRNSFDAIVAGYSIFHVPLNEHINLFNKCNKWLKPCGRMLFTYATKHWTGHEEFDGNKEFMGNELYYGHMSPENLLKKLEEIGFIIYGVEYHSIGEETFMWVTIIKK